MSPASHDPQRPFQRDAFLDDPGIVGARWWNRSFDAQMAATRRQALKAIGCFAIAVGGVAVLGLGGIAVAIAAAPRDKLRKAVDVQRKIGWSVGAFDDLLAYPGSSTATPAPWVFTRLATTLQAKRYAPFQVATQLESIGAVPTERLAGGYEVKVLAHELRLPRFTSTELAFAAGRTLAGFFAGKELGAAVIVDTRGYVAAAFAAGAASTFEPVLILDNWPHPAGVVPAHQTLGVLAFYEEAFAAAGAARGAAPPPIFVLERERTDHLNDPEQYFDNRYFVTLPSVATMKQWGFSRVLLIVEREGVLPEAGDVGATLAEYAAQGMDVRVMGLDLFRDDGSYPEGEPGFFAHHPWAKMKPPASPRDVPQPQRDAYARWKPGAPATGLHPRSAPPGFGQVIVYEDEGKIVGTPPYGGSRTRASGGYGG